MANAPAEQQLALKGVKVLELGALIAGPYASTLLAQFGADVIKIEPPGKGDPLRTWRKLHEGTSLWWYTQSRNKKSVTLDLKHPEAQEIVRKLAAEADVIIENFRPGTLEKWGLCVFPAMAKPGLPARSPGSQQLPSAWAGCVTLPGIPIAPRCVRA